MKIPVPVIRQMRNSVIGTGIAEFLLLLCASCIIHFHLLLLFSLPGGTDSFLIVTTTNANNIGNNNVKRIYRKQQSLLQIIGSSSNNNSNSSNNNVKKPNNFVAPEPKPLQISESTDLFQFTKSSLAFLLRLGTGAFVLGWKIDSLFYDDNSNDNKYSLKIGPFNIRDTSSVLLLNQKEKEKEQLLRPLVLYEYDSSPYCKRVREMINLLDLTVEYRPCPGARQGKFSDELYAKTGRRTVPYLYDPNNNDLGMFESNDQIEYLLDRYGPSSTAFDKKALWPITFEGFSIFTSTLCAIIKGLPGKAKQYNCRPDNEDMIPIELWGYESSPFVQPVREKLSELCLPHVLVSCSRGSKNRDKMISKTGRFQVPYIVDPNTGIDMYESAEIVQYLEDVYTTT